MRQQLELGLAASQAEIGISKATLSRIERGHMCDAVTLVRILEYLMGVGIVVRAGKQ